MRELINNYVELISDNLQVLDPIYEFGSLQVAEQTGCVDLRSLFPNKAYIGCDMRHGPGVDKILNLHHIDLPDDSAGVVLCLDTLEHVEYPHKALKEIFRVLKPGGIVVIASVMNFPIHEHPYDYWRFTPEAFKSLLKPFETSFVESVGKKEHPHTIIGIGVKDSNFDLTDIVKKTYKWKNKWQEERFYASWEEVLNEKNDILMQKLDQANQRFDQTDKKLNQFNQKTDQIIDQTNQKIDSLSKEILEKLHKIENKGLTTKISNEISRFFNRFKK